MKKKKFKKLICSHTLTKFISFFSINFIYFNFLLCFIALLIINNKKTLTKMFILLDINKNILQ